jgi:hypothetical protein
MGFTLFVNFTGLCLFVPHPSDKRMRVLLVDATDPHNDDAPAPGHPHEHGHNGDDPRRHEPHFPVLVYDVRDLAVPREDRTFPQGDTFGRMDLRGFDLEIVGAREDALSLRNGNIGKCPTNASARDASWLANIGTVGQRNGAVDPRCLDPTKVSPAVATRMRLTDGKFSTRFLAANNGRRPVQYQFGPENVPENGRLLGKPQAIAEVMELELKIPGDKVTLEAKSFRVAGKTDRIVLKPQLPTADVRIFVKNMPIPDIEGTRPADPVGTPNQRRSVDFHFAHFDRLLLQPAPAGQEPLPLPGDSCNYIQAEPPYLGNPQCPGIGSNPDPHA